ncbi:hypothetical protein M0802_004697 [Mischocyttarus mexicanus]|nr:hypothetical protein M0802_004697 [Mischocyttarus mexicanus]
MELEYYIHRGIMPSIKIPMPRIIDAIAAATPVMLDSTWRKIEYRLDVLRGFEMELCAKVIKSSTQLKSLD